MHMGACFMRRLNPLSENKKWTRYFSYWYTPPSRQVRCAEFPCPWASSSPRQSLYILRISLENLLPVCYSHMHKLKQHSLQVDDNNIFTQSLYSTLRTWFTAPSTVAAVVTAAGTN